MQSLAFYDSPLGKMSIAADEEGIVGIWFCGQKYDQRSVDPHVQKQETPMIAEAKRYLDLYFTGKEPPFIPPLHLLGTPFQMLVWRLLREIPYGSTSTYREIAQKVACEMQRNSMSAQAIGGAVGHNPISIIIPCHRVIGSDGSLTGYAGGIERKQYLLTLEGALRT